MTDQAQQAYADAVQHAKDEYDELVPKLDSMRQRVSQLRSLINAGSGLTGMRMDQKYTHNYHVPTGGPVPNK